MCFALGSQLVSPLGRNLFIEPKHGRRTGVTALAQGGRVPAETPTTCPYCGVGCGLLARVEGGRLAEVAGDPRNPVNRGRTCRKPLELPAAVHAADRATVPLLRERRDARFERAGW